MTLPAPLPAKLAKLVLLLGSSVQGEQLAAIAAMQRAISAAGCDWHDVAAHFVNGKPVVAAAVDPVMARGLQPGQLRVISKNQFRELLDLIDEQAPFLNLKEREFVDSLRDRSRTFFPEIKLSEKQALWFADILGRILS